MDFGKYIMLLRQISKDRGDMLWQIVPKTHYMQHLALQSRLLNCRCVQVYKEESMVGKITAIYASCADGPYSNTIQFGTLVKYLTLLCLELEL